MNNRLSKIEIVLTAIIIIVACIGIGLTVHNRVDKKSGQLTMENYTEYMQVNCYVGGTGYGYGDVMYYDYFITVESARYYKLENITISYSLKCDYADLPDGSFTVTLVDSENSFSKKYEAEFTLPDEDSWATMIKYPIDITLTSVSGTYTYSV